ncbi:protein accelerated cell death 6 [Quercus suber]|uniref:Protein accelerated cell death 6 n=1 Tax=Quercus suber TaxID=58331 RepID=A0AAW0JP62_QUESU
MDAELFNAASHGDGSFFEPNVSLNLNRQVTAQGNSVLHVAAKRGAVQIAERILRLHPSLLYRRNSKGNTPLHVAARLGRLEMT